MKFTIKIFSSAILLSLSQLSFAQDDITGVWQSIDDKTSTPKALIDIKKNAENEYSATIIKVTPTQGYKPQATCTKCTGELKNKPIVGLTIFSKIKQIKPTEWGNGQVLDPLSGKYYQLRIKLSPNGNHLRVIGYVGISLIGRSQTWIRNK